MSTSRPCRRRPCTPRRRRCTRRPRRRSSGCSRARRRPGRRGCVATVQSPLSQRELVGTCVQPPFRRRRRQCAPGPSSQSVAVPTQPWSGTPVVVRTTRRRRRTSPRAATPGAPSTHVSSPLSVWSREGTLARACRSTCRRRPRPCPSSLVSGCWWHELDRSPDRGGYPTSISRLSPGSARREARVETVRPERTLHAQASVLNGPTARRRAHLPCRAGGLRPEAEADGVAGRLPDARAQVDAIGHLTFDSAAEATASAKPPRAT